MDPQEKESFLEQMLPFYTALSAEQKTLLRESVQPRSYRKGETLHYGPQDCVGLILVQSGQLRVYFLSESGREITLFRLFERDLCLLSASCALKNVSFDVYVTTQKDTKVWIIPTPVYQQLLASSLAFSNYVGELIASRMSDVMWVMEQVVFMSFDRRLALYLLEQSAADGSEELHVTQEEMARHLGTAREVVTRMLRYFQQEGIVEVFRGGVRLRDLSKLRALGG